ncbi:MAG: serine/threonine-protein phosphatase 2A activator [archaeon]|nr:serine/threonine-protein phosphatase 2A activator [archaeon]
MEYKFVKAEKKILAPELLHKFTSGQTYKLVLEFIKALQFSVRSKKVSEIPQSTNPCLLAFKDLFKELHSIIDDTPPFKDSQRFGNKAFRVYYDKFEAKYKDLLNSTILKSKPNDGLLLELQSYFFDCFGSKMRIDYGTGHELNFLCILLILFQTQYYPEIDFPYVVLVVFFDYILLVRRIQKTYNLEPAGAHGVWGLDEYHFLPFLFGASQLIHHPDILPKSIHDNNIIKEFENEYLYLSCIGYVKSVKTGGTFAEYAPMLDTISNVPIWDKVANGLVKMYEDEVLKKYVVIQHFYFGSVLPYN